MDPVSPRKGHNNWFSVRGTLDEGDEDAEEMVPVNVRK